MDDPGSKSETHIDGDIFGPIHTGSGDIYVDKVFYGSHPVIISEKEQEALLSEYAFWQKEFFARLPLSGIPVPLDVDIPLDQVYIKLRTLPQKKQDYDTRLGKHTGITLEEALSFVQRFGELQWQRYQETDARSILAGHPSSEPILPEQAIEYHRKVVIIGVPGSGKTTLLRHLVWEQANNSRFPIPLFVPLGRADILMAQNGWSLLQASLHILTEHKPDEARARLQKALATAIDGKRVRFLFDALDEVHACKRQIVDTLTALAADDHRIVVTSRPISYERLEGFDHYEVLPLLLEDADSFSARWFKSLAEARGVEADKREEWSVQRSDWLKAQLEQRPSLREISRIPLLLTFLAILAGDEPRNELPRFRKNLYKEYTERLLTTWEARRIAEGMLTFGQSEGERAKLLALWGLYRIAYALHSIYYGNQSGEQPTPQFVEAQLSNEISHKWQVDVLTAAEFSAETIGFWEQAGLLVRYRMQDDEILAFRHLTFQEYGVSRILSETHIDVLWSLLQQEMFTPQWGEVIALTLAQLESNDCTSILEEFLKADGTDSNWHRPILLAANALADGAIPNDHIRKTIIDRLVALTKRLEIWGTSNAIGATTIFDVLSKQEADEYTADALLKIVNDESIDTPWRVRAAEAAGHIGRINEATKVLQSIAGRYKYDPSIQLWVARILSQLGQKEYARELLHPIISSSFGAPIRGATAEVLAELGQVEQAASALKELASDSREKSSVRIEAVKGLMRLGQKEPAVSLVQALATDGSMDRLSRIDIARMMTEIGFQERSLEILVDILQSEESSPLEKLETIEVLSDVGYESEYVDTLRQLAQDKKLDTDSRVLAIRMLGRFGHVSKIINTLSSTANDRRADTDVRREACRTLIGLGRREEGERLLQKIAQKDSPFSKLGHFGELGLRLTLVIVTGALTMMLLAINFRLLVVPFLSFLYNFSEVDNFAAYLDSSQIVVIVEVASLMIWPFLVYQTYRFVEPGLTNSEKPVARQVVAIAMCLILGIPVGIGLVTRLFKMFKLELPAQTSVYLTNRLVLIALSLTIAFLIMIFARASFFKGIIIGRPVIKVLTAIGIVMWMILILLPSWVWLVLIAIAISLLTLNFLAGILIMRFRRRNTIFGILERTDILAILGENLDGKNPFLNWVVSSQRLALGVEVKSMENALRRLTKQENLPAEIRWSLVGINPNYMHIGIAYNEAFQIAQDLKSNPSLRIRAAKALRRWGQKEEMVRILLQISLDDKISVKGRIEAINVLRDWGQTNNTIEALEKLARGARAPFWDRVWAMESITQVAQKDVANNILDALAADTVLSPQVRRMSQKVKQRVFGNVPINLSWLRNYVFIVLLLQVLVFIVSVLFFDRLTMVMLQRLYGVTQLDIISSYDLTASFQASILSALVIALPLYTLVVFKYWKEVLDPSEEHRILFSVIVGLILLYPGSICAILIMTHSGMVVSYIASLSENMVWLTNRIAILPFLTYLTLTIVPLLIRRIWTYIQRDLKTALFRDADRQTSWLFWVVAFLVGKNLKAIITLAIFAAVSTFITLLPFAILPIPFWIISTIITILVVISIIGMQWMIHHDRRLA